jgi:hypothetical protein
MEERSVGPAGFDLSLLRRGEVTAVIAAMIILVGLLILPWYNAAHPHLEVHEAGPGGTAPAEFGAWSGQGGFGTLGDLVILTAALGGIAVAVAGARGLELDGSGRRLLVLAILATAVVLLRLAIRPTSISGYEFDAGVRFGIFVTLAGTLLLVWAAWLRYPRTASARAG